MDSSAISKDSSINCITVALKCHIGKVHLGLGITSYHTIITGIDDVAECGIGNVCGRTVSFQIDSDATAVYVNR